MDLFLSIFVYVIGFIEDFKFKRGWLFYGKSLGVGIGGETQAILVKVPVWGDFVHRLEILTNLDLSERKIAALVSSKKILRISKTKIP